MRPVFEGERADIPENYNGWIPTQNDAIYLKAEIHFPKPSSFGVYVRFQGVYLIGSMYVKNLNDKIGGKYTKNTYLQYLVDILVYATSHDAINIYKYQKESSQKKNTLFDDGIVGPTTLKAPRSDKSKQKARGC